MEKEFHPDIFIKFATITWPYLPLFIAFVYTAFIMLTPQMMKTRKAFSLHKSLTIWNLLLTIFSFCGMIRTLPHLIHLLYVIPFRDVLCLPHNVIYNQGPCGVWKMLFFFSKIAELMDTVFIILRKNKLLFLHWYHHLTVLMLCWYSTVHSSSVDLFVMSMNYTVHTLMYGYYFLYSIGKWPCWLSPKFITIAQIMQMMIGSWVCIMNYIYWWQDPTSCAYAASLVPAIIVYTTYLLLFVKLFFQRYSNKVNTKKII